MPLAALVNPRLHHPLLVLQSSAAQSCLPLLRLLVSQANNVQTLVFCLLYAPSSIFEAATLQSDQINVFDWTERVPDYDSWSDPREEALNAVRAAPTGSLNVIIDSADTLVSDLGSVSEAYKFIQELLSLVRSRTSPSRLTVHLLAPSPLLPLLTSTTLSPALTHLTVHPPALFKHLATAYLTPPPPASPPAKFWGVFLPVRDRVYESERLVFGLAGEGSGSVATGEMVVEVLVRGGVARRGVERVLEGWRGGASVELTELESLKSVWARRTLDEGPPDPTQNVPFNLTLTPSQQQSRSQVPLPYAHEGKAPERPPSGAILYDPDSADDIDDDDPDEDLDI